MYEGYFFEGNRYEGGWIPGVGPDSAGKVIDNKTKEVVMQGVFNSGVLVLEVDVTRFLNGDFGDDSDSRSAESSGAGPLESSNFGDSTTQCTIGNQSSNTPRSTSFQSSFELEFEQPRPLTPSARLQPLTPKLSARSRPMDQMSTSD